MKDALVEINGQETHGRCKKERRRKVNKERESTARESAFEICFKSYFLPSIDDNEG